MKTVWIPPAPSIPSIEIPDPKAEKGRRKIAAKLGISNGVKTELLEGLKEGEQVILQ